MRQDTEIEAGLYEAMSYSVEGREGRGDEATVRVRAATSTGQEISIAWKEDGIPHEAILRSDDGEIFKGTWSIERGAPASESSSGTCLFVAYQRRRHLALVGRYVYDMRYTNPERSVDVRLRDGWFWSIVGNRTSGAEGEV